MATVRISEALKNSIASSINKMAEAERKMIYGDFQDVSVNTFNDTDNIMVEAMLRLIWKDYYHLIDLVPEVWLNKYSEFNLQLVRKDVPNNSYIVSIKFGKKLGVPPKWSPYDNVLMMYEEEFALMPTYASRRQEMHTRLNECTEKFSRIRNQISSYLSSMGSLNAALKDLPELRVYIPQNYLDTVDKVVTRAPRAKKEPGEVTEVDKGLLMATYLQHRIGL